MADKRLGADFEGGGVVVWSNLFSTTNGMTSHSQTMSWGERTMNHPEMNPLLEMHVLSLSQSFLLEKIKNAVTKMFGKKLFTAEAAFLTSLGIILVVISFNK